ncbi:IS66 family transposase [Bacteroides fragilis]|nr:MULTISPECIES: IS66 family transposase [Bacteroides]EXY13539.1 transposase IS66 family protein [Bacteroides fragilis str. 1007-1-F \
MKTAPENVSNYLKEAVNYLDKFWNEIFAYLKDGNYPIDNNTAERSIRKLIT